MCSSVWLVHFWITYSWSLPGSDQKAQIGTGRLIAETCFPIDILHIVYALSRRGSGLGTCQDLIGFGDLTRLSCWSLLEGRLFFFGLWLDANSARALKSCASLLQLGARTSFSPLHWVSLKVCRRHQGLRALGVIWPSEAAHEKRTKTQRCA